VNYTIQDDDIDEFKYTVVGDYLFILKNKQIEYLKIFPFKGETSAYYQQKAQLMNLTMDDRCRIKRLVGVKCKEI